MSTINVNTQEGILKRSLNPMHVWAIAFGCVIGWGSFLTVPAALRELEKIEMIKMWNNEYCFNYAITATQRKNIKGI